MKPGSLKSRLKRVLLAALLGYAGICAIMLMQQNRLLYIGTTLPPHPNGLALPAFRDADGNIIGWVAEPPAPARATVVFFHGNYEEAWQSAQNYGPYFTARGLRVVFPELPGYDMRANVAPSHDFVLADAQASLALAAQKWPGTPLWVAGNSLGAGIAALVAKPADAQRVLLFVPWDRMSAVAAERYPIIPTRFLLWADGTDYDSCAGLAGLGREVFVTYAGQDQIIPAHHAIHLAACLAVPPAQIIALPQASHLDWAAQLTAADWNKLLGAAPGAQ